jgi:hypothetical protein
MQRERRRLPETEFGLTSSGGARLAQAVRRVRGIAARETTLRIGTAAMTLAGGNSSFTLYDTAMRAVGSIQIVRGGWTVRQSNAHLNVVDGDITNAIQVFLLWLCIYPEIDSGGSD